MKSEKKASMNVFVLLFALIPTCVIGADIAIYQGSPEKIKAMNGTATIPESWRPRIVLTGHIATGDDRRFLAALKRAESEVPGWARDRTLRLNSNGGDISAAMAIGRAVREAKIGTIVEENATCASACVLVFSGGVYRTVWGNGRIGLHRPYFTDPVKATKKGYGGYQSAYDFVINAHRTYFMEMGISGELVERMIQIPSDSVVWVDLKTASRLNLVGEDATYSEWKRAERLAHKGKSCVEWEDRFGSCLVQLGFNEQAAKRCDELIGKPPRGCE